MPYESTNKQNDARVQPLDAELLKSLKNLKPIEPYSIRGRLNARINRAIDDAGDTLPASIEITRQNILEMLPPGSAVGANLLRTPFGLWRPPRFVMKLLRWPPRQNAATLWADLIHWLGESGTADVVIGIPAMAQYRATRASEDLVRIEFLPPE